MGVGKQKTIIFVLKMPIAEANRGRESRTEEREGKEDAPC